MARRPKTSYGAGINLGISSYNALKLRSYSSDLNSLRTLQLETSDDIRRSTRTTLKAIKSVADLQIATLGGMAELNKKMDSLSSVAWDVQGYLQRNENEKKFIGALKGLVIGIEKEMKRISEFSEEYPEYAIVQIEDLKSIIQHHDVRVDHFLSHCSIDEIKWAEEVLDSVDIELNKLNYKLGD